MKTARELMTQAATKVTAQSAALSQIGASYKFVLTGEGGGTWLLDLKGKATLTEGDGTADCTLKLDAADFTQLMAGTTQAPALFFGGRLQIEGDMGLAMKLEPLMQIMAS